MNKRIEIKNFKDWFNSIPESFKSDPKNLKYDARTLLRMIGYYGIKTPEQALVFFHSPAGKHILNAIIEQMQVEQEIIKQQQHAQSQHHSLLYRMLALFLIHLFSEQKAHAKAINGNAVQLKNDQKRRLAVHNKAVAHADEHYEGFYQPSYDLEDFDAFLEQTIAYENEHISRQEYHLHELTQLISSLETELALHLTNHDVISEKLDEVSLVAADGHEALKKLREVYQQRISNRNASLVDGVSASTDTAVEMNANVADNLALTFIKQLLSFSKEHVFVDTEGNASDFKNAAYVLRPDFKIVLDSGGVKYMIPRHKTLEDLNAVERKAAKAEFDANNVTTVGHSYRCEHHEKKQFLAKKIDATQTRSHEIKSAIEEARNNVNSLQSLQAVVRHELNNAQPNFEKIANVSNAQTPSPSPRPRVKSEFSNSDARILTGLGLSKEQLTLLREINSKLPLDPNKPHPNQPRNAQFVEVLRKNPSVPGAGIGPNNVPPVPNNAPTKPHTAPTPFSTKPKI